MGFLFATSPPTAELTALATHLRLKFAESYAPMPTIDDDLSQIERDIRTLKIEYEQYFGGGRPRPPADTQWRVDTPGAPIQRAHRRAELRAAVPVQQRSQTYAKYQDMWRKKLMQKEGGMSSSTISALPPKPWKRNAPRRPR